MPPLPIASLTTLLPLAQDLLLRLTSSLLILVIGWWLTDWCRQQLLRALHRVDRISPTAKPVLVDTVRYGLLTLVLITVLAQLGIPTAQIVTVIGGAILAIGLGLRDTLSNIAAGALLLLQRPFEVGDEIQSGDLQGRVRSIGLFSSVLVSSDGLYLELPNARIAREPIRNFTRLGRRRFCIPLALPPGTDLEQARSLLLPCLLSHPDVLIDPAPQLLVAALHGDHLEVQLLGWLPSDRFGSEVFAIRESLLSCLRQPDSDLRLVTLA